MATNVTRLLRKYNKHLIAIFGIGLMIVFLLPSTVQQMSQQDYTKRVIGEAYGEKIRAYNLLQIQTETQLLDDLNRIFMADKPDARSPFEWRMFVRYSREPHLDYYLLVQEAREMGIDVSQDQAEQLLRESRIPGALINNLLQDRGVPLKVLRQSVADFMSVANAVESATSGVKVTEPEAEELFKLLNNQVTINLVPVSAEAFADQIAEPTETQLASYFADHQETFRYPDRVQAEYLEADVNQIKQQVKVSKDLAEQYVKEHPSEFMKTVTPTTKPGEAPATQPVQVPMAEAEALAFATDKLKATKARSIASQAMGEMYTETRRYWSQAKTNEAGVLQKPEQVADYQQLADTLSKKYHVTIVYHRTPLISYQDSRTLTGIGSAFVRENGQPLFFGDYAFRVVPFIQPPSAKQSGELRYLVPFQDSDLLSQMDQEGAAGGFYIFRVVQTDKSHLPESLAEVKAKVVRDYQLSEGYGLAKSVVEKLVEAAKTHKLDTLAKTSDKSLKKLLDTLNVKSVEPQTFSRRTFGYGGRMSAPLIQGIQENPAKFADAVFEKLWDQPTTQPSGTFTAISIPDEANRSYYVVQMVAKEPGTADEFNKIKSLLLQLMKMSRQQEFVQNWILPNNIHQRTGYQGALPEDES
jgi:hypothetical protein